MPSVPGTGTDNCSENIRNIWTLIDHYTDGDYSHVQVGVYWRLELSGRLYFATQLPVKTAYVSGSSQSDRQAPRPNQIP